MLRPPGRTCHPELLLIGLLRDAGNLGELTVVVVKGSASVWRVTTRAVRKLFDRFDDRAKVFERFDDGAKRVVACAREEARMLNHNYIGTEHLLLGVIHEGEGVAAKALESFGVTLESVRPQVEEIIGQGQQAPNGHIPFTPRANTVFEFSLREALMLGHSYIGTGHILLGLIREGEGVGAQVLAKLGLDIDRVRQNVGSALGGLGDRAHHNTNDDVSTRLTKIETALQDLITRVKAIQRQLGEE